MKTYVFIIMVALIIALAALAFWLWWLYRREYQRRWDEISNAFTAEKEAKSLISDRDKLLDQQNDFIWSLIDKQEKLQDRLSDLLCPTSNHVWKDGKCIKCGRAQG